MLSRSSSLQTRPDAAPVTLGALLDCLQSFHPEVLPARLGQETVIRMVHRRKPYLSIVVFTTIVGEAARKSGEDAIRVFVRHENSGRLLLGLPRVHRTPTWGRHLAERVRHLFQLIRMDELPRCMNCETLMILIAPRGKQGPLLWACPQRDGPLQPCRLTDVRPGVPLSSR